MSEKNFADVASEGIAKASDATTKLVSLVESSGQGLRGIIERHAAKASALALDVWSMVVRRHRTEGIMDLFIAVCLLVLVAALNIFVLPSVPMNPDLRSFLKVFIYVVGPLVSMGRVYSGIVLLINAEYYAAAELLKRGGIGHDVSR